MCNKKELGAKIGTIQETVRLESFTPKADNQYFDLREHSKLVKRANVDEGVSMAGGSEFFFYHLENSIIRFVLIS